MADVQGGDLSSHKVFSIFSILIKLLLAKNCPKLGILVWYWFSEDQLTQSNPFCASIISSNQIIMAHSGDIVIKNGLYLKEEHLLADVNVMMSS